MMRKLEMLELRPYLQGFLLNLVMQGGIIYFMIGIAPLSLMASNIW